MKKTLLILWLFVMAAGTVSAQRPIKLTGEADSLSHALGFLAGNRILENYPGLEKMVVPGIFQQSFLAALAGEMPWTDEHKVEKFVDEYYDTYKQEIWKVNIEAGERFLAENRNKPGVVVTESGLQYLVVRPGDDESQRPRPYDDMVISYVAKTIDGTVFDKDERDSTYPATMRDGLEEGTQLMSPGAKYIFYLPHDLAYGSDGNGKLTPYSVAVYEVEMISMTRDHNYYDEDEDDDIQIMAADSPSESPRTRDAGDYTATMLPNANLNVSVEDYSRSDIVKSYEIEGFKVIMTEDRTIVLDSRGQEVFRNTLDEESNSYDSYYLTAFRANDGNGPLFLVLDIGFSHGSYYGSMLYTIENGQFKQPNDFLNLVVFDPRDDDEQYGRLTPVLDLFRMPGGGTRFEFATEALSYNPAAIEVQFPGVDFYYEYKDGILSKAGPALNLTYFRINELTKKFQQTHDYRIWHAEKGDVDGDGKADLVVFVYENETIYVCQLNGDEIGRIQEFDLPYDYSIDRSSRVLRGGYITVERDDDSEMKKLVVHNGNLVEKE